jgi:hypothetical protein
LSAEESKLDSEVNELNTTLVLVDDEQEDDEDEEEATDCEFNPKDDSASSSNPYRYMSHPALTLSLPMAN